MTATPTGIRAVVSDVDGTLLTSDKTLTKSAQAAVAELRARDIGFTIISSRPPRGLGMLLVPLRLATPFAALNGGIIAAPDLSIIAEHHIPGRIARRAIAQMERDGIASWVFAGADWLVKDDHAPLVERERHTVQFAAKRVDDFTPYLASAAKIVGASTTIAASPAAKPSSVLPSPRPRPWRARRPTISTSPTPLPTRALRWPFWPS